MLHTKFQINRPIGSGEKKKKKKTRVFNTYGRGSYLGHVTWAIQITFVPLFHRGFICNLASTGPVANNFTFSHLKAYVPKFGIGIE